MTRTKQQPDLGTNPEWRKVWRAGYRRADNGRGRWLARQRLQATARRQGRETRNAAWRRRTMRQNEPPASAVAALAVLMAAAGLWFAFHNSGQDPADISSATPTSTVASPLAPTSTAPPGRLGKSPPGPTGQGRPPRVGPLDGARPTTVGMPVHPVGTPDPSNPHSVAEHAALEACSYSWIESITAAFARVTHWMTSAEGARWQPTATDRRYWTAHVVPTHETVTCQVTGSAVDGPATRTRRGISVTLATIRAADGVTERGTTSYAVLVDRQSGGAWQVVALTASG